MSNPNSLRARLDEMVEALIHDKFGSRHETEEAYQAWADACHDVALDLLSKLDAAEAKVREMEKRCGFFASLDGAWAEGMEKQDQSQREQITTLTAANAVLAAWQKEVADGLGFLNQPEGQGGYEVAEAHVIVHEWHVHAKRMYDAEESNAALEAVGCDLISRIDAQDKVIAANSLEGLRGLMEWALEKAKATDAAEAQVVALRAVIDDFYNYEGGCVDPREDDYLMERAVDALTDTSATAHQAVQRIERETRQEVWEAVKDMWGASPMQFRTAILGDQSSDPNHPSKEK